MGKDQRRLKNWLISPLIQLKIASHIISISALFMLAILSYTFYSWDEAISFIIEMTDIPEPIRAYLGEKFLSFFIFLSVILLLQFFTLSAFLIVHTHRFLGAAYAIRRFIGEKLMNGDYGGRIRLRKYDYLEAVADELNRLSEKLETEKQE